MLQPPDLSLSLELPEITPAEFAQIQQLAREKFGLDLKPGKEKLVEARLWRLLRQGGYKNFHQLYRDIIRDTTGESLIALIDALTTNVTSFLREAEHLEFLATTVVPALWDRPTIDIWSCACATGEEVYSIAFVLLERFGHEIETRLQLLGSDISTRALRYAERAIYPESRLANLPPNWLQRFFLRGHGRMAGYYKVRPEICRLVKFERINLVEPFDHLPRFPVIFCRNVLIYFTPEARSECVPRLVDRLEAGGYMFTGLAETLSGTDARLAYVQPGVYRKKPARKLRRGGNDQWSDDGV